MENEIADPQSSTAGRARRMGLLARASLSELKHFLHPLHAAEAEPVRGPETGLVMLRGRIGGGGNAFNLGEATVTRATVRLATGQIGHGQRLGTDQEATRLSAIVDALGETSEHGAAVVRLLAEIKARLEKEEWTAAEQAAATRVDFFTLVRGED